MGACRGASAYPSDLRSKMDTCDPAGSNFRFSSNRSRQYRINVGWIFLSQGRTDVLFKLGVFTTVVVVISFVVGLRGGVEGVVIAYTIATYLVAYPVFAIAFRLIDMKVKYFLAKLWSVALAALTLGIVAFLLEISLGKLGVTQDLIILAIVTAASLLVYSVALFLLDKELFIGIVRLLDQLRSADSV